MTFGQALAGLKEKKRVRRAAWPEDAFIVLNRGNPDGVAIDRDTAQVTGLDVGTTYKFEPWIMVHFQDTFSPWAITTESVLADDWLLVG